ncbi:MAG: hypothetical protein ACTSR8_04580 [Promethearchaeota archaeon]
MTKEDFTKSAIAIGIITGILMVMVAVGFTIGILSDNPDGLERALIDAKSEEWVEGLPSPWDPYLGWIENDYIAGIIGILLSVVLIMGIFYLIIFLKQKQKISS